MELSYITSCKVASQGTLNLCRSQAKGGSLRIFYLCDFENKRGRGTGVLCLMLRLGIRFVKILGRSVKEGGNK